MKPRPKVLKQCHRNCGLLNRHQLRRAHRQSKRKLELYSHGRYIKIPQAPESPGFTVRILKVDALFARTSEGDLRTKGQFGSTTVAEEGLHRDIEALLDWWDLHAGKKSELTASNGVGRAALT